MEAKHPSTWTVREVGAWLTSLELPQYVDAFAAMAIDGMLLFEMADDDLREDLQVSVRLHRCKILRYIEQLKAGLSVEDSQQQSALPESCQVTWEVISLSAVEGQLANNTFLIGRSGASIGRNSSSNDIVVGESFVSRRHCEIRFDAPSSQFLIADFGSTTGTFLMIQKDLWLQKGVLFQMGLSEFEVKYVKFSPYGQATELQLHIYEGAARGRAVTVRTEGLTIGRDAENTLAIREDSQMSSFHARIKYKAGRFFLTDLESTNRTWLRLSAEGVPSEPRQLIVGDYIKVGSTVLQAQLPENGSLGNLSFKDSDSAADTQSCGICFTRECNAAYYPCGHMLCYECAQMYEVCSKCKRPVAEVLKVYR